VSAHFIASLQRVIMSDIAKLLPVVAVEAPPAARQANAMFTPGRHPLCDDHDDRGTPFLCARCAQLSRLDKRKQAEAPGESEDTPGDPRIEVIARALYSIECEEADIERRLNRMPPVDRWHDPWTMGGARKLAKLRRHAAIIVDALDGAGPGQ
jgi:hypothetical protein